MSDYGSKIVNVPFSKIKVEDGFNARFDYGDVEELANSIRENGVRQPIIVEMRNSEFILRSGHRRYRACELLAKEGREITIPAMVEGKGMTSEQRQIDMLIMNEGKNFTPYEYAVVFGRLRDEYKLTQAEIAKRCGKNQAQVSRYLGLLELPAAVQDLLKANKVGAEEVLKRRDSLKAEGKDVAAEITAVVETAVAVAAASGKDKATAKHFDATEAPKPAEVATVVPAPAPAPAASPAPVPVPVPTAATPVSTPVNKVEILFTRENVAKLVDSLRTAMKDCATTDDPRMVAATNDLFLWADEIKVKK